MKPLEPFLMFRKIGSAVHRACQPLCKKYDINQTCLDVLLFLSNHPEYNAARDLYTVRGIKPGLASVAVETLIQRGFLIHREDGADRRVKRLFITQAAGPLVAEGQGIQREFFRSLTRGITEDELQAYKRTTDKLLENISNLDKEGTQNDQTAQTDA